MLSNHPFIAVLVAVVFLLGLILWLRLQAFVALLVGALFFAVIVGMPMGEITDTVVSGMGSSLGLVSILIGLGAIFGILLEHSGGAQILAKRMIATFGEKNASWALVVAGFLISIPVFLDVALVILAPLLLALARTQKKPMLAFGLPLLAGMAVTHAFVPPTPGPIIVAQNIGAELGWVILFGAIVGLPAAALAGPIWAKWIVPRMNLAIPEPRTEEEKDEEGDPVSFGLVLALIGIPIALIVSSAVTDTVLGKVDRAAWHETLAFVGHPIVALLIVTLLSMYLLGTRRGVDREELMHLATKALGPAGIIILVTGAGGVFKQVLVDSGAGEALAREMAGTAIGPITLAWLLATVVRVTQGSATVSMIAASALMAPLLEPMKMGQADLALVVVAIAAGATTLSHVNDSGFWLISRYLRITEKETLRSWSVATVIISLVGWLGALVLSLVV
ncbi:GntP family permease [Roseibacillus persicicus]|uniref:Gluconate transporter n=1 Tax=Roseibacillus persicicus TaxID=454148 RepID=A0A918TI86_9BACT|nr:gluconate:H+ symporter [Roseibacillus persicicus]GHC49233.1 gluconate transporter [Roseibacillus persicicus]